MGIDTSDLTDKTYNGIIVEAEKFDDNLTLQFGLLSYDSNDERDFIHNCERLIHKMFKYNEDDMDDKFFGEPPTKESFHKALNKLLANIATLK